MATGSDVGSAHAIGIASGAETAPDSLWKGRFLSVR